MERLLPLLFCILRIFLPKKNQQNKNKVMHKEKAASGTNACKFLAVLGDYSPIAFQKTACNIQYVLLKVTLLVTIRK